MGGKSGGGARTPTIERNTLHSAQKLKFIDLISSGEIFGFKHGNNQPLKSILLNGTPIQNQDDSLNFNGVRVEYNRGTNDQDYLPSFSTIDRAVPVGAQVKKNTPITRTVSNSEVTSIRVTAGVDALMRTTKEGDQLKTSVSMTIMLMKNNVIHSSKLMALNEKGSKPFRLDFEFDDLPEVPFEIRCVRNTADSNDDMLRNNTYFFSYVESIDAKMGYPLSAVAAMEIDSEQFGNDNPERTYDLKGAIVQVPSNYDPETRTYSGLWDRLFKPAWTNNPVWILYDLLTDEIDGFNAFNKGIKIDIDSFYNAAKYCDELVDDGAGGKEPRFVCNAVFYGEDAYTAINNICSSFRAVCGYNGEYLTLYTDRAHDVAKIYNNSMVVDGLFEYSETELSQRYNQVQVQYVDENNGYETTIDEVSDDANIALVERILTLSIVAFGATKLSYARRAALWALITSLTEKVLVSFKVGASGIYHEIYDIIEIVDNDYMGTMAGGRIRAINGNIITLDREVNDVVKFSIETKSGPQNFDVKRQISETEYELDLAPKIIESAPFNAILKDVEPRLFRCTNIEENDDGTYTVSAIQHNPQKEAIVDNGAQYMPEGNTTIINSVPGLSNGIANNDGKAIILEWDSLSVIGTENKYRIQLFRDKAIYQTFETKETFLRLENLPQGEYIAKIRAVNSNGQYSEEITIAFSTTYKIDGLRAKPIVFGIELNWQLPALITTDAHTEIWYSEKDDRQTATKLAVLTYPQNNYTLGGLSVSDEFYFWVRLVDSAGNQGEFTHSIKGCASDNADDILGYLQGQITTKELDSGIVDQLTQEVKDDIDFNDILTPEDLDNLIDQIIADINADEIIDGAVNEIKDNVDQIIGESDTINHINQKIDNAELDSRLLELSKASGDRVIFSETQVNRVSIDDNYAELILQKVSEATNNKQLASQYLSLVAQNEIAKAELLLSQVAQTTANKALTQEIRSLTASFLDNEAQITELREVFATEKEAVAKSIDKITTDVEGNKSSIESVRKATSDLEQSTATSVENLHSEVDGVTADVALAKLAQASGDSQLAGQQLSLKAQQDLNHAELILNQIAQVSGDKQLSQQYLSLVAENELAKAEFRLLQVAQSTDTKALAREVLSLTASFLDNNARIEEVRQTVAENDKATATAINSLKTDVAGNKSEIENVKRTQSTDKQALANDISKVQAEVNGVSGRVTQNSTAIANVDGTVKSQYTLTTEADVNGQKVVSGFTSVNDGKTSEFIVQADKFAIFSKKNGEQKMPFVIVDNKLAMDGDMIATGSISGNKLVAGTSIEAPVIKGGRVESGHFAGGSINIGNGNFTVDSNGNLYAKSGQFEGTVYAEKIRGDLVKVYRCKTRFIQGVQMQRLPTITYELGEENYARTIYIPEMLFFGDEDRPELKYKYSILINGKLYESYRFFGNHEKIFNRDEPVVDIFAYIPAGKKVVIEIKVVESVQVRARITEFSVITTRSAGEFIVEPIINV